MFKAQRSDNVKGAAKGRVKVDVSSLADDFGGDYLARLQIVRFRACALTTPEKKECQVRTPVDSGIGVAGFLEPDLDVGDDGDVVSSATTFGLGGGAAGAVDAVADELAGVDPVSIGRRSQAASVFQSSTAATAWLYGVSSTPGSFGASPIAGSGFGDVSPNLGGFSYSYPFDLPSAPGLKPELAVSYSSQSVDGMGSRNDPQPDETGLGWQLTSAYIERQYWDCDDQGRVLSSLGYLNGFDVAGQGFYKGRCVCTTTSKTILRLGRIPIRTQSRVELQRLRLRRVTICRSC